MSSVPTGHTRHARLGSRALILLLALMTAFAGLVSLSAPAQAAEDVTFIGRLVESSSPDGVTYPWDVTTDAAGNVYVASPGTQRIRKYAADGTFLRDFVTPFSPYGVAVDADGVVYAAGDESIARFASDGASLASSTVPGAQLYGIDVDASGFVYVAGGNRVVKLRANGEVAASWPTGNAYYEYGIAVDGDGFVYVPSYHEGLIRKFSAQGALVDTWSEVGGRRIEGPLALEVNAAGQVVVTEYNRHGALLLTTDGELQASWGSVGAEDGQFYDPTGITIDDDGVVHVADQTRDNVQIFSVDPVFTGFTPQISGTGRVGDELSVTASTKPEPASWTYAWTVSGSTDVRSTSAAFTPTAADRGKTATVTVTAQGTDGEPRDRSATATKAITGKLMDAAAFSVSDSTPASAPTTGDVLTLDVDETKLPEDAEGTVRWGHVSDEDCIVPEGANATTTYPVVDADAGTTICARVAYTASGHEDLTIELSAQSDAIGTFVVPVPTADVESPVVNGTVTASVDLDDAPRGAEVTAWQWGVRDGQDCVAIEGADERTFTPDATEFEKALCVTVTVSAPHRLDATATATVGAVGAGAFAQSPTVTIGEWSMVGQPAEVSVAGGDPADADRAYQWNLDGEPIEGATSSTYTPKASALGQDLSVTVTSSSRGYIADVTTSGEVEVEEGGLAVAPPQFSTERPAVGSPVSLPLLLDDAPEGAAGHWQWGTLDADRECVAIDDATTDTFTPGADQLGEVLCAEVGVTAPGYGSLGATFVAENAVVRGSLPAIRAFLNSANPKVGSTLMASTLSGPLPQGATTSVAWGQAIAGSQCRPAKAAASYPVTKDTVGRTVCALVTVSAPGYADFSTVLSTSVIKEAVKVAPSRRVVRGTDPFVVKVQGLAPGQRYRISIRHRTFTGKADSHGRVERTVRYGKGLKSGRRTIIVRGYTGKKVTYVKKLTVTYRAR